MKGYFVLIGLILLLSGCLGQKVCNKPYILVGDACCLDENNDQICDKDRPITTTIPSTTTQSPITSMPPITSNTASTTSTLVTPTTLRLMTDTSTTTTETIPLKGDIIRCNADVDCEIKNTTFICQRKVEGTPLYNLMAQEYTPICESPGTNTSICKYNTRMNLAEACDYCFLGKCYPTTCLGNRLDYNELDVDCGGVCPPCDKVKNKKCNYNSDCGKDYHPENHTCYNGNVIWKKVIFTCLENKTCSSSVKEELIEDCMGKNTCVPGNPRCLKDYEIIANKIIAGTCFDCVKNQGETGVDCGGPCPFCAPHPPAGFVANVSQEIDLATKTRVGSYNGYEFRYIRPIKYGTFADGRIIDVDIYGTCVGGAIIEVKKPDTTLVQLEINRYSNKGIDNLIIGFKSANNTSAKIWATTW